MIAPKTMWNSPSRNTKVTLASILIGIVVGQQGSEAASFKTTVVPTRSFSGHMGAIRSIAVSPSDKYVVATGEGPDYAATVFNRETGAVHWHLPFHASTVSAVAITDEHVVTGTDDGNVRLFNLETGALIWKFRRTYVDASKLRGDTVKGVDVSKNYVVASFYYGWKAVLLDVKTGAVIRWFSADCTTLEPACPDCYGYHNAKDEAVLAPADAPGCTISNHVNTNCGWKWRDCAAACAKATACDFWTLQLPYRSKYYDCTLKTDINGDDDDTGSKALRVYTPWRDAPAYVEGDRQESCLKTDAHTDAITGVRISPSEEFVVTISRDRTAKRWDLETGELTRTFAGQAVILSMDISASGKYLVTGAINARIIVWNLETGGAFRTFFNTNPGGSTNGNARSIYSVAISGDDTHVVSSDNTYPPTATLWSVETSARLGIFRSSARDEAAGRWNLLSESSSSNRDLTYRYCQAVAFSSSGDFIVTGSDVRHRLEGKVSEAWTLGKEDIGNIHLWDVSAFSAVAPPTYTVTTTPTSTPTTTGTTYADDTSTTGTATSTVTSTTYVPSTCHGRDEAAGCGSRVPKSDCLEASSHGEFAREHCFVMCGLACTSTATSTISTTSATSSSVTTTITATTTTTGTSTTTTTNYVPVHCDDGTAESDYCGTRFSAKDCNAVDALGELARDQCFVMCNVTSCAELAQSASSESSSLSEPKRHSVTIAAALVAVAAIFAAVAMFIKLKRSDSNIIVKSDPTFGAQSPVAFVNAQYSDRETPETNSVYDDVADALQDGTVANSDDYHNPDLYDTPVADAADTAGDNGSSNGPSSGDGSTYEEMAGDEGYLAVNNSNTDI